MNPIQRLVAPFAAFAVLALALAAPALAQPLSLGALSDYLNGLTTAKASFTQINSDGTISTGTLYLARPGRMRFEYAPPDGNLVLVSNGTVAIFDTKSNQPPQQYPLKRTPLNLILAPDIDLARANMVTGIAEQGPKTIVTAHDPEHPDYGSIRLVFTADPVELRQWVVTDDSGAQTTVVLGALTSVARFPSNLFDINALIHKMNGR